MNSKRILEIERLAESVRDECKIPDYGFKDIFEAAEKLEYRLIRYPIGEDSIMGFALIRDSDRIIFSNSSIILSREIFTVAHEIGHQKLHLNENDKTIIKDDDLNDRDEFEVEANYFAACLLIPEDKINKYIRLVLKDKPKSEWDGLDIAKIQTTFNVSYDMILIRLKELGIISVEICDKLKLIKFEKTATKLLNVINGNINLCKPTELKKVPAEFLEWVISNYNDKLIPKESVQKALDYVELDAADFIMENDDNLADESDDDLDDLIRGMD
jgi:Zn-dependent peptidase ImmA (M78 family)